MFGELIDKKIINKLTFLTKNEWMDKVMYRLIGTKRKWWTEKKEKFIESERLYWNMEIELSNNFLLFYCSVWWARQEFQRLVSSLTLFFFRKRITTSSQRKNISNLFFYTYLSAWNFWYFLLYFACKRPCTILLCLFNPKHGFLFYLRNIIPFPCKYTHRINNIFFDKLNYLVAEICQQTTS